MKNLSLSLIVSFYNKIDVLKLLLDSLRYQTFQDFEVVIADDGSSDDVVAQIQSLSSQYPFPINHVWHEDAGWRKNIILNKAVMAARADYLVFVDGDCLLQRHFLQEHYENRREGKAVCGRRVMLTPKTTQKIAEKGVNGNTFGAALFFRLLWETAFAHQKTKVEHMIHVRNKCLRALFVKERKRFVLGCNFSLFKADLLKVNGFDERFLYPGYGEDIDLWYRLERAGIECVSVRYQLVMFHYYHKHFDTDYEPNKQLLAQNNRENMTYTPFGIDKKTGK